MKQIALIGPTASGKSALAIKLALKHNAYIFSIDSLSVYKEIDIASAKPTKEELASVKHFAINLLSPDDEVNVFHFIHEYKRVQQRCKDENKNLIIVGGSSFYLKSLLTGISETESISKETTLHVKKKMLNIQAVYDELYELDKEYMQNIASNDSYRIEKMYSIYVQSNLTPSEYFKKHQATPIIEDIRVYNIDVDRAFLRERIVLRTEIMINEGLIDEVAYLEQKYSRKHNSMKAIGIVEVLDYLDNRISKEQMKELIITHTAQLAKRQQNFNKTQFENIEHLGVDAIYEKASSYFTDL